MTKSKIVERLTNDFVFNWKQNSSETKFKEVNLFRKLHDTLKSILPKTNIEEYHGAKHQVTYKPDEQYMKEKARCELADLALITFNHQKEVRLTLIQAKKSNKKFSLCKNYLTTKDPITFKANIEQWYLLKQKPLIKGATKNFNPPNNLLNSAILPSIGSFLIFHEIEPYDYDFFYASTNILELKKIPKKICKSKERTIITIPRKHYYTNENYTEQQFTCCASNFIKELLELKIGTPIIQEFKEHREIIQWLGGILNTIEDQVQPTPEKPLLSNLRNTLGLEPFSPKSIKETPPSNVTIMQIPNY